MNVIFDVAAGCFAFLIENCTGVLIEKPRSTSPDENTHLVQEDTEERLQDFTKFDADDTIFREYDPPDNEEEDPKAWKKNRSRLSTTIWNCFKCVFMIQTVSGMAIGILVIFLAFLDFNSGELCYHMNNHWNKMPHLIQAIRVTAQSIEGFVLQLWSYLLLSTVFPWTLIKELNLLTLNLLAAFVDMCYRLFFQMYGIYGVEWKSYPLNCLFFCITALNAFLLSRRLNPPQITGWLQVARLTFRFSAQFVLGIVASTLFLYKLLPWFNQQNGYIKVVVAAFSPLSLFIPKAISRIAAQRLKPIHPGTVHVFVSMLYGSSAIAFRILQADINKLELYIALGVVHGIVDLLERLTITMREHIWEYLLNRVFRIQASVSKYRSPRSRRFMCDLSIQIMLQEATALVSALGFVQLYIIYGDFKPSNTSHYLVVGDFFIRVSAGLFIDLVFNTVSVVIQTYFMNFPVMRVWKKNWRHHVIVNTIVSVLSIIYFAEYLYDVVRSKNNYNADISWKAKNCTLPFTD